MDHHYIKFTGRVVKHDAPPGLLGSLSTRTFQDYDAVNERLRLGLGPLRMTFP